MGDPLPNNTISQLGTTEGYSLYCETDPVVCCSGIGSWYPPNSDNIENVDSISMHRTSGKVELRCRNSGECPSGIYDCDIPVLIGHGSKFSMVYVRIYDNGGGGIFTIPILPLPQSKTIHCYIQCIPLKTIIRKQCVAI